MNHLIQIVDPENPVRPKEILRQDFSSAAPPAGRGHMKWELRPQGRPVAWPEITKDGERIVSDEAATALREAGIVSLKDLVGRFMVNGGIGDLSKVPGISRRVAGDLLAWARAHPALGLANAEVTADLKQELDARGEVAADPVAAEDSVADGLRPAEANQPAEAPLAGETGEV